MKEYLLFRDRDAYKKVVRVVAFMDNRRRPPDDILLRNASLRVSKERPGHTDCYSVLLSSAVARVRTLRPKLLRQKRAP